MSGSGTSRRDFLVKGTQMAGAAASIGFVWHALVRNEARASAAALRPPGALPEREFAAQCIKCGQCVRACPYGTLSLASIAGVAANGTPHFEPRGVPCYMCPDLPCTKACPSGALDHALTDVTRARMGLAVIDEEHCLSWQGLRCEVCYRVCPVRGKAIVINTEPRKLSRHAVFEPMVDSEHCTGCGLCEKSCPTELAAIRVLRPEFVQGRIGSHYRMQDKASRAGQGPDAPAPPPPSPDAAGPVAPGVDYLNRGAPL